MPEKLQDRLFRIHIDYNGKQVRLADILLNMTDEQLSEVLQLLVSDAIETGEFKIPGLT